MNQSPPALQDLRNVYQLDRVLRVRPGFGVQSIIAAGLAVCYLGVFEGNASSIAVTYDPTTREVKVWEGDLQGNAFVAVGIWGTLDVAADSPPRFSTAESFGLLVLAHDEDAVTHRLASLRYDPNAAGAMTSRPRLQPGTTAIKRLKFQTFTYRIAGVDYSKAGAEVTFSAAHNVSIPGTYGAILVQVNAAGTLSTKAVTLSQSYATGALAEAALPAPDAGYVVVGHVLILAGTNPWTANTDDFISNGTVAVFVDGLFVPLIVMQADLDGTGIWWPIYFRWVAIHYGYCLGAGYGSHATPSRPEIVRLSHADDPTLYEANEYVKFGARDNPCVGGKSFAGIFVVGKGGQMWAMDGEDRSTWAPRLIDPKIGLISSRSLIELLGMLVWWSPEGPRRLTAAGVAGGSVEDAGLALDLPAPYPDEWPPQGPMNYAFSFPLPDERHLAFAFPLPGLGVTLCYVLSLFHPENPGWNIWTLGGDVFCAGLLSTGAGGTSLPPGYGDTLVTTGASGVATPSLSTTFTLHEVLGDEIVEHWYKPGAAAWVQLPDTPIDTSSGTQTVVASGAPLVSGAYTAAIRLRRGTRYRSGYESPDPSTWPGSARAAGTIVVVAFPSVVTVVYNFTTGEITVSWTAGDVSQAQDVEISDESDTMGVSVPQVLDASVVAGTFTKVFGNGSVSTEARTFGVRVTARVRHKVGAVVGAWVAAAAPDPAYWEGEGLTVLPGIATTQVVFGTRQDVAVDRPGGVSGNWDFRLELVNYGATLPNGGCTASPPSGAGYLFSGARTPAFTGTFPDTEPNPTTVQVIAPACCTCQYSPGQLVSLGEAFPVWTFAKAGTLAHIFRGPSVYMVGASANPQPGEPCT